MGIVAAYAVPHPPLIVPDVGRGEERAIQATVDAYEEVARRIAAHGADTVIVTSPHAPIYRDCFFIDTADIAIGDMSRFRAPEARIEVGLDRELTLDIVQRARSYGVPVVSDAGYAGRLDHGTFVPLHFIVKELPTFRIVRLSLSALGFESHRRLGRAIASSADSLGRRCVFVASGDLSHKLKADGPYGFAPEGPLFDERICDIFRSGDLSGLFDFDEGFCDAAAECGLRSFQIMAGALEGAAFGSTLLSHEGTFGVGYAVAAFEKAGDAA